MAIKVMLVDDEPGVRLVLRKIIEKHQEFEVAAECSDLTEAILQFRKTAPEVAFIDIGIGGTRENENGIECARILTDLNPKLKIIFATAHVEYMSEAFELYAFDYLVKPFSLDRGYRTLKRISEMTENGAAPGSRYEKGEQLEKPEYRQDRLLVKGKESMSFVDIPDIVLIQRENNATVIYTHQDRYVTSVSLSELEKKLNDAALFAFSSDWEGLPNALMEAMALGLPIVATDCPCGGPATLIENEKNGLLVPIKDADALAAGMKRLIEDPALAERLGNEARKIKDIANTESVVQQWKEYIEELCR